MASSLALILAAVSLTVVSSASEFEKAAGSASPSLVVGDRVDGDRLIYQQNLAVPASFFGLPVSQEFRFNATKDHLITRVVALNLVSDGTEATAHVVAGGPGHKSVTLRFDSHWFHGIYFIVQLYAKPSDLADCCDRLE